MNQLQIKKNINNGALDNQLRTLYGTKPDNLLFQKERYEKLIHNYISTFGGADSELHLFSVPGRSEVSGNHTDHNNGRVLACAVDLDIIAAVSKNDSGTVRVKSEGFDMDTVLLSEKKPVKGEEGKSVSLIRGVIARLNELGFQTGGFDAFTTSRVLKGSGLSSSAAFEVMIAEIINELYNDGKIEPVVLAQVSQYAEINYFGKPCGLMDQTACAVGGFVAIDFKDNQNPEIEKLSFDFSKTGYSLCIVDTAGDHASLTEEYAAIRFEMNAVAAFFGQKVLRECDEKSFYEKMPEIRQKAGDRAVIRAMHYFAENDRVLRQTKALKQGDFETFKKLVIESGRSSYMYLQNCYSIKSPESQGVSLGLAVCERILSGSGAWRVHGGGFAGTIQAFVPGDKKEQFIGAMTAIFGCNAVYCLSVRTAGAYFII